MSSTIDIKDTINNIDSEMVFIELLGLKVIGPDNSNRYFILDNNDNKVGFIQRKKIHNKKMKKGVVIEPAIYGYQMEIESDTVSYKGLRKIETGKDSSLRDLSYRYEFTIKKDGEKFANAVINLQDGLSISYWDDDGVKSSFSLNYNKFYLNFFSETNKFKIEETVCVKSDRVRNNPEADYNSEYSYTVSFCNKDNSLDEKIGRTTFEINCCHNFYQWVKKGNCEKPYMNIKTLEWRDDQLVEHIESREVIGMISDVIEKHDGVINSFLHFRYLINQLLPFESDVFECLIGRKEELIDEFILFMPEIDKNRDVIKKERVNSLN